MDGVMEEAWFNKVDLLTSSFFGGIKNIFIYLTEALPTGFWPFF